VVGLAVLSQWLDSMILRVFSNANDSMILGFYDSVKRSVKAACLRNLPSSPTCSFPTKEMWPRHQTLQHSSQTSLSRRAGTQLLEHLLTLPFVCQCEMLFDKDGASGSSLNFCITCRWRCCFFLIGQTVTTHQLCSLSLPEHCSFVSQRNP